MSAELEKVLRLLANDRYWPEARTANAEKFTELKQQLEQAQQERSEVVSRYEQI